jgi:hypothetical protein
MVSVNALRFCGLCCVLLSAQAIEEDSARSCQDDSVSLIQLTNALAKRKTAADTEALDLSAPAQSVLEEAAANDKSKSGENLENPANITVYIAGLTPPPMPMGQMPPPAVPGQPPMAMPYAPQMGMAAMPPAAMPYAPPMAQPAMPPAAMAANGGNQASNITIVVNPDMMNGQSSTVVDPNGMQATTMVPFMYAQQMGLAGGMGSPGMQMGMPPMGPPVALQTAADTERAEAADAAGASAQLLSKGVEDMSWQTQLLSGSAQAGLNAANQFRAGGESLLNSHSSSTGNAAALIKAGVQKIASQAAFAGVKSGITAGVQKGVASEGFGSSSAMQTGSLASPAAGSSLASGSSGMNNVTIVVRQEGNAAHDIEAAQASGGSLVR